MRMHFIFIPGNWQRSTCCFAFRPIFAALNLEYQLRHFEDSIDAERILHYRVQKIMTSVDPNGFTLCAGLLLSQLKKHFQSAIPNALVLS